MTEVPKVVYLPAWLDGCAKWRMYVPHLNTPGSMFLFNAHRTPIEMYKDCQVAVVQRQCSQENLNALRLIHDHGLKIVYDLDDNLWNLQASNPAKEKFKMMKAGLEICAKECDAFTVSTPGLRTAVRTALPSLKLDPIVVPNMADLRYMKRNPLSRDDGKVTVGWVGSNTHDGDIGDVWKVIPEIVEARENVYFTTVGGAFLPPKLEKHPRAKFSDWVDIAEYSSRFTSWAMDIVLAPLDDNRFNNSKSNIKMIEAGAAGSICLASPVTPYLDFVAHDSELKWCLCSSLNSWREKLMALTDPASQGIRDYYAERFRKVVEEHYDIRKRVDEWLNLFRSLV